MSFIFLVLCLGHVLRLSSSLLIRRICHPIVDIPQHIILIGHLFKRFILSIYTWIFNTLVPRPLTGIMQLSFNKFQLFRLFKVMQFYRLIHWSYPFPEEGRAFWIFADLLEIDTTILVNQLVNSIKLWFWNVLFIYCFQCFY